MAVKALPRTLRERVAVNLAAMRRDVANGWERRLIAALRGVPLDPRKLTSAEADALTAYSHGLTEGMVADVLGITRDAVSARTKAARAKLRAKNTTHAVALALRAGVIR